VGETVITKMAQFRRVIRSLREEEVLVPELSKE